MKVVLTRDVKNMGRAHEVVEAKDGYALNFLIPQKLAVTATPAALKAADARRAQVAAHKELEHKLIEQSLATLAEQRVVIRAKANEKQHLYNAIGEPEILEALKREVHVELPEGSIRLEKPIKELGTFTIPVASGETFGKFDLIIEAE